MEKHLQEVQILRRVLPRQWKPMPTPADVLAWYEATEAERVARVNLNKWVNKPLVHTRGNTLMAAYDEPGRVPTELEFRRVKAEEEGKLQRLAQAVAVVKKEIVAQKVLATEVLGLPSKPTPYQVYAAYTILRAENDKAIRTWDDTLTVLRQDDAVDTWEWMNASWERELAGIERNRILAAYDQMLEKVGSRRPSFLRLVFSGWL